MKTRVFKLFCILLFTLRGNCQYNFVVNELSIAKSKIKTSHLKGVFELNDKPNFNNKRIYKFDNNKVKLTYVQNNEASECDSFIIFGKRVGIKGKFEDDKLACNLDVTSFEVFTFNFLDKKYVLIESIKAASGIATSYIIFHLFDVTNNKNILYFPAWSVYGSNLCFGDFNQDRKLDFLAIRDNSRNTGIGTYKVTLSSINYSGSRFEPNKKSKYIIFRRTYNDKNDMVITVLKKVWW